MALVPFPDSTAAVARVAAVELVRDSLGLADSDDGRATALRLGEVAAALVERYDNCSAGLWRSTPQAILDEAALRVAGWLSDTPSANLDSLNVGRALSLKFEPSMRSALRNSGAMNLLSAWREHCAGVVE